MARAEPGSGDSGDSSLGHAAWLTAQRDADLPASRGTVGLPGFSAPHCAMRVPADFLRPSGAVALVVAAGEVDVDLGVEFRGSGEDLEGSAEDLVPVGGLQHHVRRHRREVSDVVVGADRWWARGTGSVRAVRCR